MYPRLFGELTTVECYTNCGSLSKAEYSETVKVSIWVYLSIFWVAEVTPSGWKPGKTTLKPGPELVGNVWKEWKVKEAFED